MALWHGSSSVPSCVTDLLTKLLLSRLHLGGVQNVTLQMQSAWLTPTSTWSGLSGSNSNNTLGYNITKLTLALTTILPTPYVIRMHYILMQPEPNSICNLLISSARPIHQRNCWGHCCCYRRTIGHRTSCCQRKFRRVHNHVAPCYGHFIHLQNQRYQIRLPHSTEQKGNMSPSLHHVCTPVYPHQPARFRRWWFHSIASGRCNRLCGLFSEVLQESTWSCR